MTAQTQDNLVTLDEIPRSITRINTRMLDISLFASLPVLFVLAFLVEISSFSMTAAFIILGIAMLPAGVALLLHFVRVIILAFIGKE